MLVARQPPIPTGRGTQIRVAAVAEALSHDFDVTVVCAMPVDDDDVRVARAYCLAIGAEFVADEPWCEESRSGPGERALRAATGAISGVTESLTLRRVPPRVAELVRDAQLLWVYKVTPFLDHRMPLPAGGAVVVDVDDIEERFLVGHSDVPSISRVMRHRRSLFARHRLLDRSRAALVCSEVDAGRLPAPCPVLVLPNTYPAPVQPVPDDGPTDGATFPTVVCIGLMRYGPNREGAEWLLREVWPLVHDEVPSARLLMVGEESELLTASVRTPNVELLGRVEDIEPIVRSASVVTAPIPYGSGTRIKILEAFAHRRPVVSTTAGAEGIDAVDGASIVIADDPRSFAAVIVGLLRDPEAAERIARAGRALFDERYAPDAFRATVRSIAARAVGGSGDHGP